MDSNEEKHTNTQTTNPDNIEQRITSMLEYVLKGDSSDEESNVLNKKHMNKDNVKPTICLNNVPVSDDIYVIEEPSDFSFPGNIFKKIAPKKNNTLEILVKSPNEGNTRQQNFKPGQVNKNLNSLNFANNNSLGFNNVGGNFPLSPHMEMRKDKNLANYKNLNPLNLNSPTALNIPNKDNNNSNKNFLIPTNNNNSNKNKINAFLLGQNGIQNNLQFPVINYFHLFIYFIIFFRFLRSQVPVI